MTDTLDLFALLQFVNHHLELVLVFVLLFAGIYFTFLFRGMQFRSFPQMIAAVSEGKTYQVGEEKNSKSLSSFQAFCVSTASRVGTGNLAGVATAISIGGPGAIFWMWAMALISSSSSFVENILGQLYKTKAQNGSYIGGPAHYISRGLQQHWLGIFFAISLIICFGIGFNSVQANTIAKAFESSFDISPLTVGLAISALTAYLIFGGNQRLAQIASFVVPIMAGIYILVSLYIVLANYALIPKIFGLIFDGAFGWGSITGGIVGEQMKKAVTMGIKRGLFSNEAGMGSSPNVGASAQVSHPVKQGMTQTLGVFLDTLVICTCTAFLILLSDQHAVTDFKGIQLTQAAVAVHVGEWGIYFIAFSILLFAFSSIMGNHFYAENNVRFISENRWVILIYRCVIVTMVFLGATSSMDLVWELSDVSMSMMALINLVAIIALAPIAKMVYQDYVSQHKMGKNPVFSKNNLPKEVKNIEEW